jgi:O-antigen biosynthesis protein
MKTISIIIPYFNLFELVHRRLWEIANFDNLTTLEIILANDCSSEDFTSEEFFWTRKNGVFSSKQISKIINEKNLGFGQNCNTAVEVSTGQIICIVNSDVKILKDFTDELERKAEEDVLIGGRMIDFNTGWNKFEDYIFPYLEGWFLACTRNTWEKLGGFDPRYGKFDYEDIDLSTTARQKKFGLVSMEQGNFIHASGGTIPKFYPDREEHTKKNGIIFWDKWKDKIGEL